MLIKLHAVAVGATAALASLGAELAAQRWLPMLPPHLTQALGHSVAFFVAGGLYYHWRSSERETTLRILSRTRQITSRIQNSFELLNTISLKYGSDPQIRRAVSEVYYQLRSIIDTEAELAETKPGKLFYRGPSTPPFTGS